GGSDLAEEPAYAAPAQRPPRAAAPKAMRRYGFRAGERGESPESWRDRLLPRSVIGISTLILALSVGAAFSGVILLSYYQYQIDQSNNKVNSLISGLKQQFNNAQGDLTATANAAKAEINNALGPLGKAGQGGNVETNLAKALAPSMFYVHTQNSSGQPSVGTAFVVYSSGGQSFLLTSYTTVQAATVSPGPQLFIQQGNGPSQPTSVRSWDPNYDLALIVVSQNLPAIKTASTSPGPQLGDTIYALSGFGSAGAAVVAGTIADASSSGIATDAAIGPAFQGGPIVNASGQVIAVASRSYSPGGFANQTIWYAPLVQAACTHVLTCSGGAIPGG
ncbi:MAG: S1 family peptidase, partial [Acidimicrobiales bacterium]